MKNVFKIYETLQKEDLLFSPFVELRLDNDSIIKLYLNKSDYDEIKIHKRKELQADNKKSELRLKAKIWEME